MDTAPHPLRDGNRFQRAYYRWALPYYEKIGREDPALRTEVEEIDQLLYSRRGIWAWLGWLLGMLGLMLGGRAAGLPWGGAIGLGALFWLGLSFGVLAAWLGSNKMQDGRKVLRSYVKGMLLGALGAAFGLGVGAWLRRGSLHWERYLEVAQKGAPVVALILLGTLLVVGAVQWAGRSVRERRLQRLTLLAERDAARASAAEADMRLLQAQIHPHFVFNTLATLQHWVDKKDDRAAPLLRELTGFLRRNTEMLGRPKVPLAEEAQAVEHYLAILQARQGERLRYEVLIDPATAAQPLPPGLLLTLVENAVEHGLETKIGGGRVTVSSGCEGGGWWLRVDDDGLGLSPTAQDNVGLSNLRQRLRQHFGGKASFQLSPRAEGGTRAEIRFEDSPCPAS